MASTEYPIQISLRLIVDREKNKVLFAEAEKEFMDIVLSFLTMPLGTISRLVSKDCNMKGVRFGCISSLYQSVQNLDPNYLCTHTCKEMLLHPKNPMEAQCQNLKFNIDDTQPTKYFVCQNPQCEIQTLQVVTAFRSQKCKCGEVMSKEISVDRKIREAQISEGFVREMTTFVILDDLTVKTLDQCTTLGLLDFYGTQNGLHDMTVNLSVNEVVDLLKSSLVSNSPLTELFLQKKQHLLHLKTMAELFLQKKQPLLHLKNMAELFLQKKQPLLHLKTMAELFLQKKQPLLHLKTMAELFFQKKQPLLHLKTMAELFFQKKKPLLHLKTMAESFCFVKQEIVDHDDNRKVKVKLTLTKSKRKILFAQVGNDFMDVLLSFYNCVVELTAESFKSEELKNMLINPRIASQVKANNQILPIHELKHSNYSCYRKCYSKVPLCSTPPIPMILTAAREYSSSTKFEGCRIVHEEYKPVTFLDPKDPSMKGETNNDSGFAKRNSMFMVTDELVVKPFSFISAVLFLNDSNVQKQDLEETIISIGVKEVMSILQASLTSSSALTIGLCPFLSLKCIKEEKAI